MSDPFLGEIRMFSFSFPPKGWTLCNGQILSITQNTALFSLLGTTYGGNGQTTFALPDLRGRVAMHADQFQYLLGGTGGEETHTLQQSELPAHSHNMMASPDISYNADPAGRTLGSVAQNGLNILHPADGSATMHPLALSSTGGSQAHQNMQPFLTTSFAIAVAGIYPSRN